MGQMNALTRWNLTGSPVAERWLNQGVAGIVESHHCTFHLLPFIGGISMFGQDQSVRKSSICIVDGIMKKELFFFNYYYYFYFNYLFTS